MQTRRFQIQKIIDDQSANAFLFGVIFNQAQRAERSWEASSLLAQRLGTLDPYELIKLPISLLADTIARSPSLHRFPRKMAEYLSNTCDKLVKDYVGDARNIWAPPVPLGELVRRFTAVPGIGSHKASIAAFLLTIEFGVPVLDDGTLIDIKIVCPRLYHLYFPFDRPALVSVRTVQ